MLQGGEGLFILINMTASCAGMKGSKDEVHSYPDGPLKIFALCPNQDKYREIKSVLDKCFSRPSVLTL